jgi:NADPH:quinone reductase-like Zn-dependent oxidoreductase
VRWWRKQLKPGETVLINGASGGLGAHHNWRARWARRLTHWQR